MWKMKIKTKNGGIINTAIISDEFPTPISWNVDGREIILPEQLLLINNEEMKRGGIPICFPNFGPATYNGTEIRRHGFLRDTKALLRSQTGSKLMLHGKVADYGLSYDIIASFQVNNLGAPTLIQTLATRSTSGKDMPICLAFHPYFKINRKYLNFIKDGVGMDMNLFNDSSLLQAKKFGFHNTFEIRLDEDLSVEMTCLGDFETGQQQVCIWSDSPNQYICIEPIMHDHKLFGTPQGCFVGGKEKIFNVSYTCKIW